MMVERVFTSIPFSRDRVANVCLGSWVVSSIGPVDKDEIWAEKSYSRPIFSVFSSCTGIPEYLPLNALCKTQDSSCWPKFFCAHRSYQNKSCGKHIFGRHPPAPGSSEGIFLWTYCSSDGDIKRLSHRANKCILLQII